MTVDRLAIEPSWFKEITCLKELQMASYKIISNSLPKLHRIAIERKLQIFEGSPFLELDLLGRFS